MIDVNGQYAKSGLSWYARYHYGLKLLAFQGVPDIRSFGTYIRAVFEADGTVHCGLKYVGYLLVDDGDDEIDLPGFATAAWRGFLSDQVTRLWGMERERLTAKWVRVIK